MRCLVIKVVRGRFQVSGKIEKVLPIIECSHSIFNGSSSSGRVLNPADVQVAILPKNGWHLEPFKPFTGCKGSVAVLLKIAGTWSVDRAGAFPDLCRSPT